MKSIKLKLLFALLLIIGAGCTKDAKPQDGFTQLDTLVRTVRTYYADTISLGSGQKSITIHNTTGGIMQVAFNKGSSSSDPKDSVNFYSVPNGNRIRLFQRTNYYMYLKSSVSGTASIVIDYGFGFGVEIDPVNFEGALNTTMSNNISVESVGEIVNAVSVVPESVFDVRDAYGWKTGDYGAFDTLGQNGKDTLSRVISNATNSLSPTVTQWFKLTVVSLDSPLVISPDVSMPPNKLIFIPPGGSTTLELSSISAITNYFITKRWAVSGAANYHWFIQYK
jgi:hypothetical protein